jgi:hypothetical protein
VNAGSINTSPRAATTAQILVSIASLDRRIAVNRTTFQCFKTARWVLSSTLLVGMLLSLVDGALGASGGSGIFTLTGSLNTAPYDHTATLLPNGKVLVVGGLGVNGVYTSLASAELYDPQHGNRRWAVTGSLSVGRDKFTATLLPNGQVLVAGGTDYQISCYATAELYNPSTGQWTLTGSMSQPRCLHSATLLSNGEVLVSGGVNGIYTTNTATVSGAEIYNPNTGTWTPTGSLNTSRAEVAEAKRDRIRDGSRDVKNDQKKRYRCGGAVRSWTVAALL